MTYTLTKLIEYQIIEIIEHTNYKANILRSQGFTREADKEIATGILTALILIRAYCKYMYLEKDVCIPLENMLKTTLAVYTVAYKIDVEDGFLNQLLTSLKHRDEETISIPT